MKINELAERLGYETAVMPTPDAEVTGGYTGDLLSWVMGRASAGNVWVTIMTNTNIVAVASLVGVSAIVIAEGLQLPAEVAAMAEKQGINILRSPHPTFETSSEIGGVIGL